MTLFASLLQLDRAAIKALKITDPYSLHRVVYGLYPDIRSSGEKNTSQTSGILYADRGGDFHGRKIIMLANREPAKHAIDKEGNEQGKVTSEPVSETFLSHTHYRFKTIINPTRRIKIDKDSEPERRHGKLMPIKDQDEISQWFMERAVAEWGFQPSLPHLQIDKTDVLEFENRPSNRVTISQVHIQGQLTVTNPETFRQSFTQGIGRAHAFGCGLLQIAPLVDNPFA